MQKIGDFLEKLGMPEYGECFAQNKIDLSVLPHLTDQPHGHWRPAWASAEDAGGHPGGFLASRSRFMALEMRCDKYSRPSNSLRDADQRGGRYAPLASLFPQSHRDPLRHLSIAGVPWISPRSLGHSRRSGSLLQRRMSGNFPKATGSHQNESRVKGHMQTSLPMEWR